MFELQMYQELQLLSPLVPTRHFYVLRYCQQIEQGVWAVVDVSYNIPRENQIVSHSQCHRFPSGCLIQDMPNGYSKVLPLYFCSAFFFMIETSYFMFLNFFSLDNAHRKQVTWIEHVEVEDRGSTHWLFRDLIHSGLAFGAERWLATLQRMAERFACLMVTGSSNQDLSGGNVRSKVDFAVLQSSTLFLVTNIVKDRYILVVIPSLEGKRSMMKLAQRMVNNFCASISTSHGHRWTTLSGMNEVGVRVTVHKSTDSGQPNGVVLSAATTIWLPVSPQTIFNFFKNDRTRSQVFVNSKFQIIGQTLYDDNDYINCVSLMLHQWDVLSDGNPVQEVAHISNGSHPGNCISVLRVRLLCCFLPKLY